MMIPHAFHPEVLLEYTEGVNHYPHDTGRSPHLGSMKSFTAVVERCAETDLYVGYVLGFPGAHSQGASLDELKKNLEVQFRHPDGRGTTVPNHAAV